MITILAVTRLDNWLCVCKKSRKSDILLRISLQMKSKKSNLEAVGISIIKLFTVAARLWEPGKKLRAFHALYKSLFSPLNGGNVQYW